MSILPLNPGANPDAVLPPDVRWLPQEATVALLGQKTNCYLLLTGAGTWVVDPPSDSEAALAEIESAAEGPIAGILLTHTHPDHTGGVAALAQRTGVAVHAHPLAQAALPAGLPFRALREGDEVGGWRVLAMPGHRYDHLCFVSEAGCAIVGDLVAGAGTVILDPTDGDLGDYLRSLQRLRDEVRPALLCPGHGPLVDQPAVLLTHFIEHRLARERLVLDALRDDPAPLAALLPHAYPDTPAALYPLAERSLLTHLMKLKQEGRAAETAAGWRRESGG